MPKVTQLINDKAGIQTPSVNKASLSRKLEDVIFGGKGGACCSTCRILVPLPGIEPESPALEGGLFTSGPPGKYEEVSFRCVMPLALPNSHPELLDTTLALGS